MKTNSFEDDDAFVDAFELPQKVVQRASRPQSTAQQLYQPHPQMITPQRPGNLNVATEFPRSSGPTSSRPKSMQGNYPQTSYTPRPLSAVSNGPPSARDSSAHRDRLQTLRRRMNVEFGNRDMAGPSGVPDFDVEDTMSTMSEAPSLQSWHHRMINKNETTIVKASDTMSTCALSIPHSFASDNFEHFKSPHPPLPIVIAQKRGPSLTTTEQTSSSGSISPCSKIQPPPIPSREHVTPPKAPQRIPPPLPPRTPCMKLPDPIAIECENRMREEEILGKTDALIPETPGNKCEVKLSKSNDSILSNGEIGKGHRKNNSFDRSITLAKSMKTFPTSSSVSNKTECEGEEQERNNVAEEVIAELTTDLEKSNFIQDAGERFESFESGNSSITTPSSSAGSKREHPITVIEEEKPCSSKSMGELQAIGSAREESEPMCTRSVSNGELKTKSESMSNSFDPITLDVERRLSMKRSGQPENDGLSVSSDDTTSRMSVARSGIGHATLFARSSVLYASGKIRGALRKVRSVTSTNTVTKSGIEEETSGEESETAQTHVNIVRPRKSKKGPFDFENLTVEQELDNEHTGAVWCIKFSICGRLMATAGQDSILRVWVVRSHLKYFSEMRDKYSATLDPTEENINPMENVDQFRPPSSMDSVMNSDSLNDEDESNLFCSKPFAVLKGHTADILDVSWSKNYFILSSGMDRTVKLWHLSRNECLCCFQHVDFVTCVGFLPKDDRFFLSGSLDGKLRLWHIPDKKVAVWNEVQVKFITAMTFVKNGKFAVVGTYNGRCYFYTTDQLKYHTVVDVRSTRGKNAKGHKVTGLAVHGDKLLVTSNDSRIRMYDIRDKALTCKFKGVQNDHSQIRAAFSPDGRHIICGSEDKFVYLWRTSDATSSLSVRKDRNSLWERVRTHNAAVSVAIFAPRPHVFFSMLDRRSKKNKGEKIDYEIGQSDSITSNGNITVPGHVIVSADLQGVIKIMVNRPRQCKVAPAGYSKTSVSSAT